MTEHKPSAKRDAILEAATTAFREYGYDASSMDRISEIAAVSKRTVYNHFGSKEALFQAVVDRLVCHAKALKEVAWDPDRSVQEQLHDFIKAKTTVATDPAWAGLIRVVLGVAIRNPELAMETTLKAADGEDALVRWLGAANKAGRMNADMPIIAANVFWAMVTGALFWPQIFGMAMTDNDRAIISHEMIKTFLSRYGVTPPG